VYRHAAAAAAAAAAVMYGNPKLKGAKERIPTRCNNIDDLLSIVDVEY